MSFRERIRRGIRIASVCLPIALVVLWPVSVNVAEAAKTKTATARQIGPGVAEAYLVLSLKDTTMSVRMGSVILREYHFSILSDSAELHEIRANLASNALDSMIVSAVYLTAAAEVVPGTELEIIAEETKTDPGIIQRYLPGEMVLVTNRGLRVYLSADCPNAQSYRWRQFLELFRRAWHALSGGDSVHLKLSADDALSLYGIAQSNPRLILK